MITLTITLDPDDARDINAAIARYQSSTRWPQSDGGGVLLPEGESDLPGAILGEICRYWLDKQMIHKEGE